MTIAKLEQRYLAKVKSKFSRHTLRVYTHSLRDVFNTYLKEECDLSPSDSAERLRAEHFIQYPEWLSGGTNLLGKPWAKSSLYIHVAAVRGFLKTLTIAGYVPFDLQQTNRLTAAFEDMNYKRVVKVPRMPTEEDIQKMLRAVREMPGALPYRISEERIAVIKARNIALLEFLASTGCRNEEAVTLTLADLNIPKLSGIVLGKGRKERVVYYDEQTAEDLQHYWNLAGIQKSTDPVFAREDKSRGDGHKAMTTGTPRWVVKRVALYAGIDPMKFSPHYFRHGFATATLKATGNLVAVQNALGHTSIGTTQHYLHLINSDVESAVRDMQKKREENQ